MRNKTFTFLALLFLSISVPLSGIAKGEDSPCKDIAIVFARGSGQNPNHEFLDKPSDERFKDKEPQSYAFFDEISKRLTGVSVEKISLHNFEGRYNQYGYEAIDVWQGFNNLSPTHRTDVYNRYYESVADGAEELAWFLEDRITSCPFQQIILGGYSQGAHVVGDALFKIKPNFRPRIAYVALFGDPKFNPRTSAIPPITGPWVRGNVSSWQTGVLLARKNYLPDEMVYKTSWCDINDPICANYSLANTPIGAIYEQFLNKTHQDVYQNKWIPQAGNEIAKAIKDRTPSLAGNIQTATWVNKNDHLYKTDLAIVLDVSGSMITEIANIKKKLDSFVTALFNSYWDTRIALVGFSDTDYLSPYTVRVLSDFTYSKEPIRTSISAIKPTANMGGDEPEALIAGLMTAMDNLSWRKDAQKKILVISDAAPKSPDPLYGAWTKEQIAQKALEMDPVSISFKGSPRTTGWYKLADIYANYFASATNGVAVKGTYSYLPEEILQTLTIMDSQPVADIDGPTTGYVNEPLPLSGGASYDPDGVITSYSWDCNNDGVWEVTNTALPTTECTYATPYEGFVVLEVKSANGGSAKATLVVSVTERAEPLPVVPDTPVAHATRSGEDVVIAWSNNYSADVTLRISGPDGNVLGLAAGNNSFTINQAPASAFEVILEAGNVAGWSKKIQLGIAELPPLPEPTPMPTSIPEPSPELTPTPTPTPTPVTIPSPTSVIANQSSFIGQALPTSQLTPLTNVAGASDEDTNTNDATTATNDNNSFVTSDESGLDTFLLVFGLIILGIGITAITRRPK
jgi:hypothetical protein